MAGDSSRGRDISCIIRRADPLDWGTDHFLFLFQHCIRRTENAFFIHHGAQLVQLGVQNICYFPSVTVYQQAIYLYYSFCIFCANEYYIPFKLFLTSDGAWSRRYLYNPRLPQNEQKQYRDKEFESQDSTPPRHIIHLLTRHLYIHTKRSSSNLHEHNDRSNRSETAESFCNLIPHTSRIKRDSAHKLRLGPRQHLLCVGQVGHHGQDVVLDIAQV